MQARMRLMVTAPGRGVLAARAASNSVMRDGSLLVARLFAGMDGAAGITHMGVGTSGEPETGEFTTAALANDDPPLAGAREAAIPPTAFTVAPDPVRRVTLVKVRATLPATAAVGVIREAGLLSRTGDAATLYNRVTFESVDKGGDHEMTMFWEIEFPYGDLHGLA